MPRNGRKPASARRARHRARRRLRPGRRRRPGAGAGRAAQPLRRRRAIRAAVLRLRRRRARPGAAAGRGGPQGRRRTSAVRLHPLRRRRRAGRHHPWTQGAVRRPRALLLRRAGGLAVHAGAAGRRHADSHVRLRPGPGQPHRGRRPGGRAGVGAGGVADDAAAGRRLHRVGRRAVPEPAGAEGQPGRRGRTLGRRRRLGAGLAAGLGRRARLCAGPSHGQRHARHLGHRRIAGAARRCAASRNTPGRCARAARPEPPRSAIPKILGIPQISSRFPADLRQIPGRPPYQQRHSKETTRERQRFPTRRAATPDQQALENATYRKVALRFIPS